MVSKTKEEDEKSSEPPNTNVGACDD
ncbi:BnaCnng74520D [Brassica napus]|uniref:BnaCnng74520D protein n=1 Tax=Brassica napus TaxID=3708 RepID=A0A078JZL4_BRANA|nr:BnaCnng74520D [Brassica napus]